MWIGLFPSCSDWCQAIPEVWTQLRFNLFHLLLFVTAVACWLGVLQLSIWLAMAICPFLFGPTVGHATSPNKQGVIAGFFSAAYWSLLFGPIALGFYIFESIDFRPDHVVEHTHSSFLTVLTLIVPAIASTIGGYIGGRVAKY